MIYDNGERDVPLEQEVSFWVLPWRMMGILLFNFALIIFLVMYVIRLRKRLKQLGSV
jgi:hypothetical protein